MKKQNNIFNQLKKTLSFLITISVLSLFYCGGDDSGDSSSSTTSSTGSSGGEVSLSASISGTASSVSTTSLSGSIGKVNSGGIFSLKNPAGCGNSAFSVYKIGGGTSIYGGTTNTDGTFTTDKFSVDEEVIFNFSCASPVSDYLKTMKCLAKPGNEYLECDPLANAVVQVLETKAGGSLTENTSVKGLKVAEVAEKMVNNIKIASTQTEETQNIANIIDSSNTGDQILYLLSNALPEADLKTLEASVITVKTANCGDGVVDTGEACDKGGLQTAMCELNCKVPVCGDFITNTSAGEECDSGGKQSASCEANCLAPVCGDGILNRSAGESCDGVAGCTSCQPDTPSTCDGVAVETGEDCDSGGTQTALCEVGCKAPSCGDGILNTLAGESCDNGYLNSDTKIDGCRTDCTAATCGDGVVDTGEVCDSGGVNTYFCNGATCTRPVCGDGVVTALIGENCDDGNIINGDGCSSFCRSEACGNSVVDGNEACDSGGTQTIACEANCTAPVCGDGIINTLAGESCDDGNAVTEECDYGSGGCTVCGSTCQDTAGPVPTCGDGTVQTEYGELCDDGGTAAGDGCSATCLHEICGDGVVQAGETCDSWGINSASCNHNCTASACGDFIVNRAAGEVCDDGNTANGDGCSASCTVETGSFPVVSGITITGTPTGATGGYKAGDQMTVSWNVSDPDGIANYILILTPEFDLYSSVFLDIGGPRAIYGEFDEAGFLPPETTSVAVTVPEAVGGTYYPLLAAFDNLGHLTYVIFDSKISSTNMTQMNIIMESSTPPVIYTSSLPITKFNIEPNGFFCGDNLVTLPEECDDGGSMPGDGCDASCVFEEPTMACDINSLDSISFDSTGPFDISLGQSAKLSVQADYRCAESVSVNLQETTTLVTTSFSLKHTGVGLFEASFPESIYNMDGTWEITNINIYDASWMSQGFNKNATTGLYTYASTGLDTTVPLAGTVTITGATVDTTPPVLVSANVTGTPSGANYQMGDVLNIEAVITENVSGIDNYVLWVDITDDFDNYGGCYLNPTGVTDTYACSVTLEGVGFSGTMPVYAKFQMNDIAGNYNNYYLNAPTGTYFDGQATDSAITVQTFNLDVPMPTIQQNLTPDTGETAVTFNSWDEVWLTFNMTAGTIYQINWNDTQQGNGAYNLIGVSMYGFKSDGTQDFSIYNGGYYGGYSFLAETTGSYYLKANPWGDMVPADIGVSVSTTITPTPLTVNAGTDTTGSLMYQDESLWYSFTADGTSSYTIKTGDVYDDCALAGYGGDVVITVYNGDGTLYTPDSNTGCTTGLSFTPAAGTVNIKVYAPSNYGATPGTYGIQVTSP